MKEISKKKDRDDEAERKLLSEYNQKRQKTESDMNEKIAIAEQTLALIESYVKKLDCDLGTFEAALRGGGDFEVAGAQPGQEVCADLQPDSELMLTYIYVYICIACVGRISA